MAFGLDYATPVAGSATLRAFKKAGVTFVCRYISTLGNPKNLTAGEVTAIHAAGLGLVVVFETTANRALGGYQAGNHDAISAIDQVNNLGLRGIPVYFAVDFDASGSSLTAVTQYFQGAVKALGHDRVGIYGGLRPVTHILDHNICKWAWQTYAWSGGRWDPRGHIQQYQNGQRLAGVTVDYNRSIKPDFGQWPRPASPAVVTPKFAPPWPVFAGATQIANGRLINPAVVVRISRALRAAGKKPPYVAFAAGKAVAKGRFWPPGKYTRALAGQLRSGHNVDVEHVVEIRTRKV